MEYSINNKLENIQLNDNINKQEEFDKISEIIETEINKLFNSIKLTTGFNESKPFFFRLAKIQFILANLFFVQDIYMTNSLKKFVHDFERLDDMDLINYLYSKIKKGEYSM